MLLTMSSTAHDNFTVSSRFIGWINQTKGKREGGETALHFGY